VARAEVVPAVALAVAVVEAAVDDERAVGGSDASR